MFELGVGYRSTLQFEPPLADSRDFPVPVVRATPGVPLLASIAQARWPDMASVLLVDRARTALHLVGQHLGRVRVWLPAYHCPAMIEPFLAAACEVCFYPVSAGLEPDIGFLQERMQRGEALVAVRYFGFDCAIREVARFSRERGVLLIEDLAHAAYAHEPCGDFAVTSLVKFLPIDTGAELVIPVPGGGVDALAALHRALPGLTAVSVRRQLDRVGRRLGLGRSGAAGYRYFDRTRIQRGVPRDVERILVASDHAAVRSRRQENFRYLFRQLEDSALGRPLFAGLPDDVVPYVFPFLLHDAAMFGHVRRAGIQALRWEELAPTSCEVSAAYRGRLVQLPLHQCVDDEQLQRMVDCLVC
ncbi:MAG: hypothetical protein KDI88_12870 [Gammaproteobacteria bacterium]|nr:hypothetical protein [Gammaproteobacteria bacterium]